MVPRKLTAKLGMRQAYVLSRLLANILLEVLGSAIEQEKEIKVIWIIKEVKLSLKLHQVVYVENLKGSAE